MLAEVAAQCLFFYKHLDFSVNIHTTGTKRSAAIVRCRVGWERKKAAESQRPGVEGRLALLKGKVALTVQELCWDRARRRWSGPRAAIGEVEELGHIRHGAVTRGKRREIETRFHELQERRVIHGRMRDEVLFRERRDD